MTRVPRSNSVLLAVTLAALGAPAAAQTLATGVVTAFAGYVSVPVGKASVSAAIPIPACPPGEKFLVQSVAGAPDPRSVGSEPLPPWAVLVGAGQFGATFNIHVPLAAWGQGAQNAEAHFPGGVAHSGSVLSYSIHVVGGLQLSSVRWNVHVSGACGKPSVTP